MSNENMPVEQHFPMSDDPKEPVEQSQDLARIKRAYQIACFNITELTDQRAKLTTAIDGAMPADQSAADGDAQQGRGAITPDHRLQGRVRPGHAQAAGTR